MIFTKARQKAGEPVFRVAPYPVQNYSMIKPEEKFCKNGALRRFVLLTHDQITFSCKSITLS